MKLLSEILYKAGIDEVTGPTNIAIECIQFDSRKIKTFSLFVAISGTVHDGHKFIDKAIEEGALAIVCENFPKDLKEGITYIKVKNSAIALARIADNFHDHPASKLQLIGVTGTNGKTTTVSLLQELFKSLGYKTAMISTVVNKILNENIPSTHTTPDPIQLNELWQMMVDKGVQYCFMEVSSHALDQHRVLPENFKVAVFTNITHDHLDYHKTFNEYISAKKTLFDGLRSDAYAIINVDDTHGEIMMQNCKAKRRTFAIRSFADFKAKIIENQFRGLHVNLDGNDVYSKLIGGFNAYNLLAVYTTAIVLGIDKLGVLTSLSNLNPVQGRFQYIKTKQNIAAVVDYAHTPDALKNVLKTIGEIRTGNENVITVIGCGGDRDKQKRPIMAKIACDFSDRVILTSDNPRSEDPEVIIQDMQRGIDAVHKKKTHAISDRREAIKMAVSLSQPGDILLVAGKGHEKYQEIKGEKFPFDDLAIIDETLKMFEK